MNESFIPLHPTAAPSSARTDYRVAVINPAQAPQPFRPLNHANGSSDHKPVVTLQREGERISSVRIQCACGQLIELTCVYPAAATESAPPTPTAVKTDPPPH